LLLAVNKKGKRKVNVKGREYLWSVEDGPEQVVPAQGFLQQAEKSRYLHIISNNKRFIVHYRLPQAEEPYALLRIEGPDFPREPGATAVHIPRWRHDSKRYPTADFVRRLIGWCLGIEGNE
jgi:hypothetical protein